MDRCVSSKTTTVNVAYKKIGSMARREDKELRERMQSAVPPSSPAFQRYVLDNGYARLPKRLLLGLTGFNEAVEEYLLDDATAHLPEYVTNVITNTKTLLRLRGEKILLKDSCPYFHQACINFLNKSASNTLVFMDLHVIGDSMEASFPSKFPVFVMRYISMLEAVAPHCERIMQLRLYEMCRHLNYLRESPVYGHASKYYFPLAPIDELLKNFSPVEEVADEEEETQKEPTPLDWETLLAASEPIPPKK